MTLPPSLLRELENPNLSVSNRAELCCEAAKLLEYKGEYDKARKLLSDYWTRIGEHPKLEGLEPSTAAEVLLRAAQRYTPFDAPSIYQNLQGTLTMHQMRHWLRFKRFENI